MLSLIAIPAVVVAAVVAWFISQPIIAERFSRKGDQAIESGLYELADSYYQQADSTDHNDGRYKIAQARVARMQRQFGRAREILQQVRSFAARDSVKREALLLEIQEGNARQHHEQFGGLLNQYPDDVDSVWHAYVEGFENEEAIDLAYKLAESWIKERRDSPLAHLKYAQLAQDRTDLSTAQRHYQTALRLQPNQRDAWEGLTQVALLNYDYRDALQYSEQVLRFDPENVEAKLHRAQSLTILQRDDEAMSELEHVLRLQSENFSARFDLANLLIKHEQAAKAIAVMKPFESEFNNDVAINYMLALAHQQLGDDDAATLFLQKHLDGGEELNRLEMLIENTPEPQRDFSFCKSVGMSYLQVKWDAAFRWLDQAAAMQPVDAALQNALADFARKRGDKVLEAKYREQAELVRRMLNTERAGQVR
ncbi:tetratricopeptide repeat protein [Stieleria varia]|uniref:Tetratricopeptide repeat protein n=2 Tax=Stieleria varia TaxID=2528005 RepID=A0A5C6AYE5_9BACT|nr:tetratricopeptide repeat protein [Stieleria varia]